MIEPQKLPSPPMTTTTKARCPCWCPWPARRPPRGSQHARNGRERGPKAEHRGKDGLQADPEHANHVGVAAAGPDDDSVARSSPEIARDRRSPRWHTARRSSDISSRRWARWRWPRAGPRGSGTGFPGCPRSPDHLLQEHRQTEREQEAEGRIALVILRRKAASTAMPKRATMIGEISQVWKEADVGGQRHHWRRPPACRGCRGPGSRCRSSRR